MEFMFKNKVSKQRGNTSLFDAPTISYEIFHVFFLVFDFFESGFLGIPEFPCGFPPFSMQRFSLL